MNKPVSLDQGIEGAIYEIVEVVDGELSKEIGAYKGMSAVVLKKALQSMVQIGYAQIELERESLKKIIVQPV